ncbi:MAG TPA: S41 family peptidase [Clostridiales bacterium]|nr:S41 family peptidase [Clostridia bacterium]MDD4679947.1 S41 family peptidase [Clostridia bacterium]HCS75299.1 S41 family peptidase [Clostridiales bacterium]
MISRKSAIFAGIILILITALLSSYITLQVNEYIMISQGDIIQAEEYMEMKDFYRKFNQIKAVIQSDYLIEPELDTMLEGAIKGMVSSLDDPYSYYLTAEEYQDFLIDVQGTYAGVGLSVSVIDNMITVVTAFKGSPAATAGITSGDRIIAVNGKDMDGSMMEEAVSIMRGEPDTQVKVSILRKDEVKEITLTRAIIDIPDLEYRMLDDEVGYLWLYRFDKGSSQNFLDALNDLHFQGMKGLVLDLRSNPGGLLDECVAIADMLLPQGLVLYSEDKEGTRVEYTSNQEMIDIPLAVLINQYSASASEVLSGAIQDHETGLIIGETTFGKGLVQTIRGPFKEGDVIKLTSAQYFTPNGRDINKKGVTPDIKVKELKAATDFVIENPNEELPLELDAPLTRGLKEVKNLIGEGE